MPARTTVDGGLLRTAYRLEGATLAWNVAGTVVLVLAAAAAGSVALVAFALDSMLEIGATAVVIWELRGGGRRQERALRLLGAAFAVLAAYLVVQPVVALAAGHRPHASRRASRGPARPSW